VEKFICGVRRNVEDSLVRESAAFLAGVFLAGAFFAAFFAGAGFGSLLPVDKNFPVVG
jgi:hypothetical protein